MSAPQRHSSPSEDREGPARKRVGKACDRCRLKKSKCNGLSACSRCQADNAICVFGERRRIQDRVYPRGYVEMLEQQQAQLVAGIRELYHRLQSTSQVTGWLGKPLELESNGHPLTHSILERLDLLYLRIEGGPIPDGGFEDDPDVLRQRMLTSQGISESQERMMSGCSTPPDSDDLPYSHSHTSSFDGTHTSQLPLIDFKPSLFDIKTSLSKSKTGKPRQNKAGIRHHHPYRRPEEQARRRKHNDSVSSMSSVRDTQDRHHQQLSSGFQMTMEQLPHVQGAQSFCQLGHGAIPPIHNMDIDNKVIGSSIIVSIPPTSASFNTDLLSSPMSQVGMVSSNSTDFPLPASGSPSSPFSPTSHDAANGLPNVTMTTTGLSGAIISTSASVSAPHRFGHHHGDSVSSISTIDSNISSAEHMFDLGHASLDDSVSLFDPFVAGDSIIMGDDDPLSVLGSFVSESMNGNAMVSTAGVTSNVSATSTLVSGGGIMSPGLGDLLALRQSGIMS